jgi:hypothetical protein
MDETAERQRLKDPAWKRWGPYLSERAWGTVREDYSENGIAWDYFPHDHARSRAYRWNEDGLGGWSDDRQFLCFAFAFWNGRDPILKERIFGLTGSEGNHGEDAKEYWWYLDGTPTHSYMVWRYVYPQQEFPYVRLVEQNRLRGRDEPEFELIDSGVLDSGYWDIYAEYAKAAADDLCVRLTVRNSGPNEETLHVLPSLWFRNTWSWGRDDRRPSMIAQDGAVVAEHHSLGRLMLTFDGLPETLFCENESNAARLWGVESTTSYPKDGIGDRVLHGRSTVNPDLCGTKAALWYQVTVPAGRTTELRMRLSPERGDCAESFSRVLAERRSEADDFYSSLTPAGIDPDDANIMRQAFAGMLWSKQFYHYDVEQWLDGDPRAASPPPSRQHGRNGGWRHLNNSDVISMPDKWEYPWYAAWDLAFHCVALAHLDPEFAKAQLILLCREWYMHPNGQLPAYEWAFGDVNPPVHGWAALRVFEIDGNRDHQFLARILQKLLLNFTWWVNRKDAEGRNVFEGGFLGMDNIGPIDRSAQLPVEGRLEQADGTAWMAMYCLNLLQMALILAEHDPTYEDLATKFFEHFAYIANAIHEQGLWDEEDGFYYDVLTTGRDRLALKVRSMVGLIPLYATTTLSRETLERLPDFAARFHWFLDNKPQYGEAVGHVERMGMDEKRLLSIVSPERLMRVLARMLDEDEFLAPYGLRSVSKSYQGHPFMVELGGMNTEVAYEPAESRSGLFGGNSNWRGPIWFPVNYLLIESLQRFAGYLGEDFQVECPTGSGRIVSIGQVATDVSVRLIDIFRKDRDGRRPVFGGYERFQKDPAFHDSLSFNEYFDGDTGMGLGASHQTGWTGLVADLILSQPPP